MNELEGLILRNRQFGYCKVVLHLDRQAEVRFCGNGRTATYTLDTLLRGKDFQWEPLPVGTRCKVKGRGECVITKAPFAVDERSQIHEYTVEFDGEARESAQLSERDLWPIVSSLTETAQTRLGSLRMDPWPHFRARDNLLSALARLHRDTSGIHALAASRIELLAHQASVVRTVLDDVQRRYILADEVGLGKTVEAGVILHQLLTQDPKSRVLILTPGPLSRQWLCEMRLSFGDREFKLADLHPSHTVDWAHWSRIICSLKLATVDHRQALLTQRWDLVIVDEAHHLLWNQPQYNLVQGLSDRAGGILLLSAVPARERAGELLRLLQLLDSKTYASGSPVARDFEGLYQAQGDLGRRMRILQNRQTSPSATVGDLQQAAHRLAHTAPLDTDTEIQSILDAAMAKDNKEDVAKETSRLIGVVASKYRISRRILKNRRSQLLDQNLIAGVERKRLIATFDPGQLARGAHDTMTLLFRHLHEAGACVDALQVVYRKAVAALCDPVALMDIATSLRAHPQPTTPDIASIDSAALLDYDEHPQLLESACAALSTYMDRALVDDFHTYASNWLEHENVPKRIEALTDTIDSLLGQGLLKLVVFAGTMGSAELVIDELSDTYGSASVAEFRFDLPDDVKEDQVTRFRRDDACRILVCDESGGEGRNFQFASAVIHFDLPWSVAAVEQRIGRLDRLGRQAPVLNVVMAAQDTAEVAWVEALDRGFEVFTRSISGLEFMLRETEHKVVEHVICQGHGDIDSMIAHVQEVSQKERANDDADALTDIASFDRGLRVAMGDARASETRLEESFPRYMRSIGVGQVARQIADNRDPNLKIWRLKPEDVTQVELPGIHRNADGQIGDHYGTFQRRVARERPDLDFFTAGHALFDAVCAAARTHVTGRTFAVQFDSTTVPAGQYLLTTWAIAASPPGAHSASTGRAQRHLEGRQVRLLLDIHTSQFVDHQTVRRLEPLLLAEDAAVADRRDQITTVLEVALDTWPQIASALITKARDEATRVNADLYAQTDQDFRQRLTREIERLQQDGREDSTQLIAALTTCRAIMDSPHVQLDSVGIIHIANASHVAPSVS